MRSEREPMTRREFERARFDQAISRTLKKNPSEASLLAATAGGCSRCGKRSGPSARYCDRCGRALPRGLQPSPGFTQAVKRSLAKDLQAQARLIAWRDGITEAEALKRLRLRHTYEGAGGDAGGLGALNPRLGQPRTSRER